ncbi:hypothetical protein PENTCL1PPCAC_30721 [Pristionchus entomophagus]|uniref:Uncharacterized protein n=1 Tax=Pristionchus entomophagus TaxID=358040 RepID=A0AAV5UQG5_9BILA|nr:hypothetical protein PENTCL1PPCAC_30721 [Pristionchus entomophagus]
MGSTHSSQSHRHEWSRSGECRREFFSKDFAEYNKKGEWAHDRNKFSEFNEPRKRNNDAFFSSFDNSSTQYNRSFR